MTGRRKTLLLILAAVVIAAGVATQQKPLSLSPEQAAQEELRRARLARAAAGATALRTSMRNPKSFELAQVWTSPSGATCYEYRGQNGFGGLDVENALIRPGREALDLSKGASDGDFIKLWNKNCTGSGADLTAAVVKLMQ